MEARGQWVILTERWGQFPAGTEARLLEVGGLYALIAIGQAPLEVPLRILRED